MDSSLGLPLPTCIIKCELWSHFTLSLCDLSPATIYLSKIQILNEVTKLLTFMLILLPPFHANLCVGGYVSVWMCVCGHMGVCEHIKCVSMCVWHTWMCECVCVGVGMYECMCEHMWVCLCVHKWWCGGYMWVYECACGTCECVNRYACVNVWMLECVLS